MIETEDVVVRGRRIGVALSDDELRRVAEHLGRMPTEGAVRVRRAVERALLLQSSREHLRKLPTEGPDRAAGRRRGCRHRAPGGVERRDVRDRRRARVAQPPFASGSVRRRRDRYRRRRARRAVHGGRRDRSPTRCASAAGERALPVRRAASRGRHRGVRQRDRRAERRRRRVLRRVVRRQRAGQRRGAGPGQRKGHIHSRAPQGSAGWDIVLVGKATDRSGFGGASFPR